MKRISLKQLLSAYGYEQPKIDPDLTRLPLLERVTEALRYTLSCWGHAISPTGSLKRWLQYWMKVGLGMGIPVLVLLPLLLLVSSAVLSLTETLLQILCNLGLIVLPLGLLGLGAYGLLNVYKK